MSKKYRWRNVFSDTPYNGCIPVLCSDGNKIFISPFALVKNKITHWMYLPEPPPRNKEGQKTRLWMREEGFEEDLIELFSEYTPIRVLNALATRSIYSINDLTCESEESLLSIRNFGKKSLICIKSRLALKGLELHKE